VAVATVAIATVTIVGAPVAMLNILLSL